MSNLTNDELEQIYYAASGMFPSSLDGLRAVAEAAIAAERAAQKPVAWGVVKRGERVWYVNDSRSVCEGYAQHYQHRDANGSDQSVIPLYTTPPAAPVPEHLPEATKMVVPDGYVLVPVDLTPAMWRVGRSKVAEDIKDWWRAMLAAAPEPKK